MLSRQELIDQGWYADPAVNRTLGPSWAKERGWDGVACWLTVEKTDILKAVPGLKIHSVFESVAYVKVMDAPRSVSEYSEFFEELEFRGLDNLAFGAKGTIECNSGMLHQGVDGDYYISGPKYLHIDTGLDTISCPIPSRLVLCKPPGEVTLVGDASVIPPFKVPCSICLSASRLNEQLYDADEHPYFSEKPDLVFLSRNKHPSTSTPHSLSPSGLLTKFTSRTKHTLTTQTSRMPSFSKKSLKD